jgi:hypothetical protein
VPINVDAADWNKAYEAHQNKQMTQKRAAQRSEAGDREEGSIVVKENRLAKINGYSVKRALGKGAFVRRRRHHRRALARVSELIRGGSRRVCRRARSS